MLCILGEQRQLGVCRQLDDDRAAAIELGFPKMLLPLAVEVQRGEQAQRDERERRGHDRRD